MCVSYLRKWIQSVDAGGMAVVIRDYFPTAADEVCNFSVRL